MTTELSNLQALILLYGFINLSVRWLLRQPLISAALAFWAGWAFLISSSILVLDRDWRFFHVYSVKYIETLFHGAFIGFLFGALAGLSLRPRNRYKDLLKVSSYLLNAYGGRLMMLFFVTGTIFFLQRVATVGFSADYLSEVRSIYNQRNGGFLLRLSSHMSVLMTTFVMMRGIYDSHYGVNIRALSLVVLAGAPLGLANGGRAFLMSYLLTYSASLLLARSHSLGSGSLLRITEFVRLLGFFSLMLLVFAIMGFARGGYGEAFNILYTILIWPVSTLYAMDSWVGAAITSDRTYGMLSLGWVADFAARLGLLDASQVQGVVRDVLFYFEDTNDSARVIPRSILPDLIFDFGERSLLICMLCIAFLLEYITSRCVLRSVFLHALAVACLLGSFMTIQNSVVTPGFAVSLFWAAVLGFWVRVNRSRIFLKE